MLLPLLEYAEGALYEVWAVGREGGFFDGEDCIGPDFVVVPPLAGRAGIR